MTPPLLDLRYLQMIAKLAETPRVTDAAEAMGITPSALSHRIREAERRLDVPLFTRVNKRLRLTPAAEHLARVAEPDREYAKLFRLNGTYPNWTETVELPEAIVEMVAAGLGTSVLAGWAVQESIDSKRIVGARVGLEGIRIPWYAATRGGDSPQDQTNRRIAELLAQWCKSNGGFPA